MSVEKLLEDTTTASMVQEADKVPEQEADDSSGVTNDSVGMNDGLLQTQNRYEAIGCDEEIAVASQARDWFKGLTSEERSGAVSFTDGAFLGTFLAFTAPWSTTTNAGANPRDVERSLNWGTMVSLSEFEAKFEELEKSLRKTPKLANRKTSSLTVGFGDASEVTAETYHENGASDQNKIERGEFESNAFIIKHSKFAEEHFPERGSLDVCDNKSKESGKEYSLRQKVFEEIAVIFPSAFKHILGINERYPHVIIRPTYFDRVSSEEQFLALASVNAQFLSCCSIDAKKRGLQWLRRLSWGGNDVDSVPLYALLIARFEWAAWESFLQFERSSTMTQQVKQEASENKKIATKSISGRTETAAVDTKDLDYPRTHLLSILGDVLSHCGAMNDISMTIDSSSVAHYVAPFVDVCLATNCSSSSANCFQVENVILTPLSWLFSVNGLSSDVDLVVLDKAVAATLRRMDNHWSGMKQIKSEIDKSEQVQRLPSKKPLVSSSFESTGLNGSNERFFQKKNKGKKRKNKKAFYTGSLSGANKAEQKHFASPVKEKVLVKKTASVCSNVRPMVAPEPDQKEPNDDNPNQPRSSNNSVVTEIREATSFDSDDTAEESSVAPPSKVTAEKREDLAISLHDGRIIVAPASSCEAVTSECAATAGENASTENCHNYASGDCWETVEVRGRGNRKKPSDRPQHSGSRHSHHSAATTGSHDLHGGSTRKSKVSRSTSSRKKIAAKKIVREILVSVVDSIEEESRRRKQSVPSAPRAVNSWKLGPPGTNQQGPAPRKNFAAVVANAAKRDTTLRDVVAGKRLDVQTTRTTPVDDLNKRVLRVEEATHAFASLKKVYDDYDRKSPGTKPTKCQTGIAADQNTAQTYQETVSASSNARASFRDQPQNTEDRKSDTSSGDTDEGPHNRDPESVSKADVKVVLTPPLPTLLSPENANSATSSVASSLEAPYAGRSLHHCVKAVDVNDVGYHLLDVCDRLSRDMSLFMSRRALALSARRRERGALLAALQDSVSSIWPGKCHVELYGSCATQLDLPASDIDVVVLGLDSAVAKMNSPPSQIVGLSRSKSASSESIGAIASIDAAGVTDEGHQHTVLHHMSTTPFGMIPVHLNAERVARLASDLEGQPWAVQVNAIPTASVPVVKVLADASKLARASHGGEWMAQHQHIAAQAAAKGQTLENRADQEYTNAQYILPALLPWRGSDVMKGLLSLDITFEGPEHGGIGSTEFSARTVAEACAESGLHPDATPFVQVLMVLKELLAQRKLNEPYSGGLSSYALLLLVLALVHERSVIREEIELVEQQKRAMATGALDAFDSGANDQSPSHVYNDHPSFSRSLVVSGTDHITKNYGQATTGVVGESCSMNKKHGVSLHVVSSNEHENGRVHSKKNAKKSHLKNRSPRAEAANPGYPASNSWATVAMKNSVNKASSAVNHSKQSEEVPRAENSTEKSVQKPSFADAAAKSAEEADAGSMFGNKVRSKIHDDNVANETTRDDGKIKSEAAWSYNSNPLNTKSATDASDSAAPTNCLKEGLKVSLCGSVLRVAPSFYPQGYNDIVEVLCSGETTAGKLLMHFLLFYGQHFDAQSTAIDISGKHERDFTGHAPPYSYLSPYIQRRALGNIDPITGMLTVDPIVIYDPLEGAENNNVARRCFAWNSVRWIFAQSYTTLASAVERSATPPATPGGRLTPSVPVSGHDTEAGTVLPSPDAVGDIMDPSSPLLRCLLSF